MTKKIGRNQNTNDESGISSPITLNTTTSTVLAVANPDRIAFHVGNNDANAGAWIKLQAASVDNDMKGIFLNRAVRGDNHWDMSPDNIYTGEISAIANTAPVDVYVTEY